MKRYDPIQYFDQGGSAYGDMKEVADGDFVKFEDARAERQNLVDTIEACLVAAGGSPVLEELQQECRAAGTKPSDFVRDLKVRKDNLEKLLASIHHHYGEDSTFSDWLTTMMKNIETANGPNRELSRYSEHRVEQVTWNDDGTTTLVARGHIEPVRNGDTIVYFKAK